MAKKKIESEDAPGDNLEAPAEEVQTDGKSAVTVTWRGGTRVYSRDVHGKDFKALAKEFAEKKNGTVA
jgi:hypothetical protein